jgi:hypothetical protein
MGTPLKPEAQKVIDDVNALPKTGKADGNTLYTDLVTLYKADGGKDGQTGKDMAQNPTYTADMKAVNDKLHASGVLPDVNLFAATQNVVAFVDQTGKVVIAPKEDLSSKVYAADGKPFTPGTTTPDKTTTTPDKTTTTPDKTGQPATTTTGGDAQQFGLNGRQYTKTADGTGYQYQLRQQAKGNDSIWWAAKDYLRSAHPDRTGDKDITDAEVGAKVRAIYDANKKGDESYADFQKRAMKMKVGDGFTIPIEQGETTPDSKSQPAQPASKTAHSDQVDDTKTKTDANTGMQLKSDTNGKPVEIDYDAKHSSVVHRAADGSADGMTDWKGNKYTRGTDGTWTGQDSSGKDIPASATGPVKGVDMDADGNITISRNDKATDVLKNNGSTVKTDGGGNPIEVDYANGAQTTVQRGADGTVTGLTDGTGNTYTKTGDKWTATHTNADKTTAPIADPPGSGPITKVDMDKDGVVTISRTGQAKDVISSSGRTTSYPDFDGTGTKQADTSVIKSKAFNGKSQVVEIDYPNNTTASFQRNADGTLDSYTDGNSNKYTFDAASKTWFVNGAADTNTQGAVSNIDVTPTGIVTLTRQQQAKDVYASDGSAQTTDKAGKASSLTTASQAEVDFDPKTGRPIAVVAPNRQSATSFTYTDDTGFTIKSIASISQPFADKPTSADVLSLGADGTYKMAGPNGDIALTKAPTVDSTNGDIIVSTSDGKTTAIHPDGSATDVTPAPPAPPTPTPTPKQ